MLIYLNDIRLTLLGRTGSAKTKVSPTVKFPGGYNANDAGIFTPNVFNSGFKYTFPGPAIAKFSNTGAAAANIGSSPSAQTSKSSAASSTVIEDAPSATTSTIATSTGKTHCRRGQAAVHGWNARMEKRYVGAPAQ